MSFFTLHTSHFTLPVVLWLVADGLSVAGMARAQPAPAGQAATVDSTGSGDAVLVADSLSARFSGQGDAQGAAPPSQGLAGSLRFGWTPTPLRHHGLNVFQPIRDDPRLHAAIRQLKRDFQWDPFQPGVFGNTPYDYHYSPDGNDKRSFTARFGLTRPLLPDSRWGFAFDSRYDDLSGPFPNQRTTRLHGLLNVAIRHARSHTIRLGLLGMDEGWYLNRGNRVFTDRARYMLEQLNTWRARSGGLELSLAQGSTDGVSFTLTGRYIAHDWASDPPEPSRMIFPAPGDTLPLTLTVPSSTPLEFRRYIGGVYPVVTTTVAAETRGMRSLELAGEFGFDLGRYRITFGADARAGRLADTRHWQTLSLVDRSRTVVRPREFGVYAGSRFRWWAIVMAVGLRYEVYQPGASTWQDVFSAHVDDRVGPETVHRLLLASGGEVRTVHLLSPLFSVSYPSERFNFHLTFGAAAIPYSLDDRYQNRADTPFADQSVPHLLPRRTLTGEGGVGFSHRAWTLDAAIFYRDAGRYLPRFGPDILPQTSSNYASYWGRVNPGWQRQSGVQASLIHRSTRLGNRGARVSGRLSYLYLFDTARPHRWDLPVTPAASITMTDLTAFDSRLNDFWNRRHYLALTSSFRFPSGLTLTAVGHLQSGVPYRQLHPPGSATAIPATRPESFDHGPWMRRIDGRLDLPLGSAAGRPGLILYVEGRNITNERIIDAITDPASLRQDGIPDNALISQTQWVYGPARSVWTGVEVRW